MKLRAAIAADPAAFAADPVTAPEHAIVAFRTLVTDAGGARYRARGYCRYVAPETTPALTLAQRRTVEAVEAELARLIRYDDESLGHDAWIRQRYDGGLAASYAPARAEAARTAWHEAGHAVAALAVGAQFSSASIRAGGTSAGRVHGIQDGA